MNLPFFISRRIVNASQHSFSATINRIAVASIAIGIALMSIAFLILGGYQREIQQKVFSLGGHIQVTRYSLSNSMEEEPISVNNLLVQQPDSFQHISHVQKYSHKAGLIKANEEVMGVLYKGIGPDYDTTRFRKNLVRGHLFSPGDTIQNYSREVVISDYIANKLQLDTGQSILVYFIQDPPRTRRLQIVGIYNTGIEQFDEQMILGDINLVRRLNNWNDTLIGGLEVYVNDFEQVNSVTEQLNQKLDYSLYVEKISDKYLQIFDWLGLINNNVRIFLALILFVSSFNMVSILLILIMERTSMIGLLKALGASSKQIRRIFHYNGMQLIIKGMLIGNVAGISFGLLQQHFKLIPLDPENYYVSYVPIQWDIPVLLLLNVFTFLLIAVVLNLPTLLIMRIQPIKAIRFD